MATPTPDLQSMLELLLGRGGGAIPRNLDLGAAAPASRTPTTAPFGAPAPDQADPNLGAILQHFGRPTALQRTAAPGPLFPRLDAQRDAQQAHELSQLEHGIATNQAQLDLLGSQQALQDAQTPALPQPPVNPGPAPESPPQDLAAQLEAARLEGQDQGFQFGLDAANATSTAPPVTTPQPAPAPAPPAALPPSPVQPLNQTLPSPPPQQEAAPQPFPTPFVPENLVPSPGAASSGAELGSLLPEQFAETGSPFGGSFFNTDTQRARAAVQSRFANDPQLGRFATPDQLADLRLKLLEEELIKLGAITPHDPRLELDPRFR